MGVGRAQGVAAAAPARGPVWATILVLVLAIVPFLPTLGNGFAMDARPLASGWADEQGRIPDPVVGSLLWPNNYLNLYYWYPDYVNDGLYRPVTIFSYALVFGFAGQPAPDAEALPQHVVNLLLHALAAWLALHLLLRLRLGWPAAHVAAGLFAVHAIHSEVVAGIVGRAELLAFCFGVGGILLALRGLVEGGVRPFWLLLSMAALYLAYGSKESGLVFGPLLLCCYYAHRFQHPEDSGQPERAVRPLFLPWLLATACIPMTLFLAQRLHAMDLWDAERVRFIDYVVNPLSEADLFTRWATAVKVWGYGLWLCLAPFDLSASYGAAVFSIESSLFSLGSLGSLVVLVGFLVVGVRHVRRQPALFLAMACFLGGAFVTSNIPFAIGTLFAERLYFLPSLGVCILGGLAARRGGRWVLVALALWAAASATVAWQRSGVWKDSATLFLHEAENQPRSADMLVKAAGVLRQRRGEDPAAEVRALRYLDAALELVPGYPHALRERAALFLQKKDYAAAAAAYEAILDPANTYRELPETRALALDKMATIALQRGDKEQAVRYAEQAVESAPRDGDAWVVLAHIGPEVRKPAILRHKFNTVVTDFLWDPSSFTGTTHPSLLALYLGVMGERVRGDATKVYQCLEYGVRVLPAGQRPPELFRRALLSMALAKIRLGEKVVAGKMLGSLLANPDLPADFRAEVEAAAQSIERR